MTQQNKVHIEECSKHEIKIYACECFLKEYARLKRLDKNIKEILDEKELSVITKGLLRCLYDE